MVNDKPVPIDPGKTLNSRNVDTDARGMSSEGDGDPPVCP